MQSTTIQTFKSQYRMDESDVVALVNPSDNKLHIGLLSGQDYDYTYVTTTPGSFKKAFLPGTGQTGSAQIEAIVSNLIPGATAITDEYLLDVQLQSANLLLECEENNKLNILSSRLEYDQIPNPRLELLYANLLVTSQTNLFLSTAALNLKLKVRMKLLPVIVGMDITFMMARHGRWSRYIMQVFEPGGYTGPIDNDVGSRNSYTNRMITNPQGRDQAAYGGLYIVNDVFLPVNESILSVHRDVADFTNAQPIVFIIRNSLTTGGDLGGSPSDKREIIGDGNFYGSKSQYNGRPYFNPWTDFQTPSTYSTYNTTAGVINNKSYGLRGQAVTIDGNVIVDSSMLYNLYNDVESYQANAVNGMPPNVMQEIEIGTHVSQQYHAMRPRVNRIWITNAYDYQTKNYSISPKSVGSAPNIVSANAPFTKVRGVYRDSSNQITDICNVSGTLGYIDMNLEFQWPLLMNPPVLIKQNVQFPYMNIAINGAPTYVSTARFYADDFMLLPTATEYPNIPVDKYHAGDRNQTPSVVATFNYKTLCQNPTAISVASSVIGYSATIPNWPFGGTTGFNAAGIVRYTLGSGVGNAPCAATITAQDIYNYIIENSGILHMPRYIRDPAVSQGVKFSSLDDRYTFKVGALTSLPRVCPWAHSIDISTTTFTVSGTYYPTTGPYNFSQTFPAITNINIDASFNGPNNETVLPTTQTVDVSSAISQCIVYGLTGATINILDSYLTGSNNYLINFGKQNGSTGTLNVPLLRGRSLVTNPASLFITGYYNWTGIPGAQGNVPFFEGVVSPQYLEPFGFVRGQSLENPLTISPVISVSGIRYNLSGGKLLVQSDVTIPSEIQILTSTGPTGIFNQYIDPFTQELYFPSFSLAGITNTIQQLGISSQAGINIDIPSSRYTLEYVYGPDGFKQQYTQTFFGATASQPIQINETGKNSSIITIPLTSANVDNLEKQIFGTGISSSYFTSFYNGYTGGTGLRGSVTTPNMLGLGVNTSTFRTELTTYGKPNFDNSFMQVKYTVGNSLYKEINYVVYPLNAGVTAEPQTLSRKFTYYPKEQREIIIANNQYTGPGVTGLFLVNVRSNPAGYTFTEQTVNYQIYNPSTMIYYNFCKLPYGDLNPGDDISAISNLDYYPPRSNILFEYYDEDENNFDDDIGDKLKTITTRTTQQNPFIPLDMFTTKLKLKNPANKGFINQFFVLNNIGTNENTASGVSGKASDPECELFLFVTCTTAAPLSRPIDVGLIVRDTYLSNNDQYGQVDGTWIYSQHDNTYGFCAETIVFDMYGSARSFESGFDKEFKYGIVPGFNPTSIDEFVKITYNNAYFANLDTSITGPDSFSLRLVNNNKSTKYDTTLNFGFTGATYYSNSVGQTFPAINSKIKFYGLLPDTTYSTAFITYNNFPNKEFYGKGFTGALGTNPRNQVQLPMSFRTGVTGIVFSIDSVICNQEAPAIFYVDKPMIVFGGIIINVPQYGGLLPPNERVYDLELKNMRYQKRPDSFAYLLTDNRSPYNLVIDMHDPTAEIWSGPTPTNPATTRLDSSSTPGVAIISDIRQLMLFKLKSLQRGKTYSPTIYLQLKVDTRYITNSVYLNQIKIPKYKPVSVTVNTASRNPAIGTNQLYNNSSWNISGTINNCDIIIPDQYNDTSYMSDRNGFLYIVTQVDPLNPGPLGNTGSIVSINAEIPIPARSDLSSIPFTAINLIDQSAGITGTYSYFGGKDSGVSGITGNYSNYIMNVIYSTSRAELLGSTAQTYIEPSTRISSTAITDPNFLKNTRIMSLSNTYLTVPSAVFDPSGISVIKYIDSGIAVPYTGGREVIEGRINIVPYNINSKVIIKDFNYYKYTKDYSFPFFYGGTLSVRESRQSAPFGNLIINKGSPVQDQTIILNTRPISPGETLTLYVYYSCMQFGVEFSGTEYFSFTITGPPDTSKLNDVIITPLMHSCLLSFPVDGDNTYGGQTFDEIGNNLLIDAYLDVKTFNTSVWVAGSYPASYYDPTLKQTILYLAGATGIDGTRGIFMTRRAITPQDGPPAYGYAWKDVTNSFCSLINLNLPIDVINYGKKRWRISYDSTSKISAVNTNHILNIDSLPSDMTFAIRMRVVIPPVLYDYSDRIVIKTLDDEIISDNIVSSGNDYLLTNFRNVGSTGYFRNGSILNGITGQSVSSLVVQPSSITSVVYRPYGIETILGLPYPTDSVYDDYSQVYEFGPLILSCSNVSYTSVTYYGIFGVTLSNLKLGYPSNSNNYIKYDDSLVITSISNPEIRQVISLKNFNPLTESITFNIGGLSESSVYSDLKVSYQRFGSSSTLKNNINSTINIPAITTSSSLSLVTSSRVGISSILLDISPSTMFNGTQLNNFFTPGVTGQSLSLSLVGPTGSTAATNITTITSDYGSTGSLPLKALLRGSQRLVNYTNLNVVYKFLDITSQLRTLKKNIPV